MGKIRYTIKNKKPLYYNMVTAILYYFFILLVIYIISFAAYIKLKYHFWSLQPVFHFYDYHYHFYKPQVIQMELPETNRYCNLKNIEYSTYNELRQQQKLEFYRLIRSHFLQNEESKYTPTDAQIEPYFSGHNSPSHISLYYSDDILVESKTNNTITRQKLVGTMTSRPLHVTIQTNTGVFQGTNIKTFDCNYVDYLCVHSDYRKNNIASELIQTHYYHNRREKKGLAISLFKREGILTGIVPLCVYNSHLFNMVSWRKPLDFLPTEAVVISCGSTNIHLLFEFLRKSTIKFSLTITTDISNFMELIKSENIHVFMLLENDEITAVYIFRDTCSIMNTATNNNNNNNNNNVGNTILACIGSINDTTCDYFVHGYKVALWKIIEKHSKYVFNVVEDISDNGVILDNLLMKTSAILQYPCAYFFYNYIYGTYPSKKIFMIH